ncbi:WW domain binding protein 4 [Rhinolophus ferrumequinum]|uniref:WW domain binding protein 4 n=1 Tax=Rhinolophus ferrumequinum TaxID=59479 RepID=A0A7J7ZSW9_RHIFE|nr:WW domain binding protein 4 [Rhinolophus ferrumequinum]
MKEERIIRKMWQRGSVRLNRKAWTRQRKKKRHQRSLLQWRQLP